MKKILFAIFLIINTGLYSQNTYTINTGSYYYTPSSLTIDVGDSVIWINDGGYHDVNGDTNSITGQLFNNPVTFDSPATNTVGAVIFAYKFTVAGTYNYDCSVGSHAANGMVGVIIVQDTISPYTSIPDQGFEFALFDMGIDSFFDGQVLTTNISGITNLNVDYRNISDLTGIEDFTSLTSLNCEFNQLSSLDVSQNSNLTYLNCEFNQLSSLDVSQNSNLTYLNCEGNQLSSLDVSQNTALTVLSCGFNQLNTLDVSQNTALTALYCYINQLTSLDLSQNTALTDINCDDNQLTSLDLRNGNNLNMGNPSAYNNPLICVSVDDSAYSNANWTIPLVTFSEDCSLYTPQYTLIPDQNFEQELINQGYDNVIDQYVLTANISGVMDLFLMGIGISDLTGIEDFSSLTTLECSYNQLSSLDVSQNSNLTYLDCQGNQLTTLDVSQNSNLTSLSCQYNQLTNLNINGLSNLLDLNCEVNQLTSLDVSQNSNLTNLNCLFNQLTTLMVNGANNLVDLYCSDNQLTTLDLSNNIALNTLWCSMNQITTLDVNNIISLSQFDCSNNQIVSLDLSNNIALTYLVCSGNNLNCLNVKNGYNLNLNIFADFNDSLTCIEVDNVSYSTAAWNNNVDTITSFSLDCIGCGCDVVYTIDTLNTNVADIQFQNYSPQTYLAISDTFPQVSSLGCDSIVSTYRQLIYNPNFFTDTILTYDTIFNQTYDTTTAYDTLITYDTLTTYDTVFNQIYDTTIVFDTLNISVIDTSYISISVTDTLYIDITVTGMTSMDNTITVYPNPANDVVIIDNGNYSIMNNYNLMIFNSLSQQVFFSQINTQQFQIPVSSLGAEGTYIIQIFDSSNNLIKTKYLILN